MYETWRILLDTATTKPGLGFDDAAEALAELVVSSPPQFAIGIFGVWGSGKTTLMQAIHKRVEGHGNVVPVGFNAWRYEREDHLIVPMLDTLRDALVLWAERHPTDAAVTEGRAAKAASTVAKAARAILAGFTLKAKVLGVEAAFDPNKAVADWHKTGEADDKVEAENPQSFYHASFRALEGAIGQFVADGRRIVVFIDDLDRCLPEHALQVLESMKLFFDLPGFVFVVGLDQDVIERAVTVKYGSGTSTGVSGADYVKKIFQVQFAVPRVVEDQLDDFVRLVAAELPGAQGADISRSVRPHLTRLATNGSVNPREVKRFVNDYTVQMKMLEKKLGSKQPPEVPDARAVLALLTMSFHREWRGLYDQLVVDPDEFKDACRELLDNPAASPALQLGPAPLPVPASFVDYLRNEGEALGDVPLQVYVSSVEATGSTDTVVVEAKRAVRQIRRAMTDLGPTEQRNELPSFVSALQERLRSTPRGHEDPVVWRLDALMSRVYAILPDEEEGWLAWTKDLGDALVAVDGYLRELRRRASGAPTAA